MNFDLWLGQNTNLSDSSIYKYSHAINTISNDMLKAGIIKKNIIDMQLFEIDLAISLILSDKSFSNKNIIGNNMYSSALKWYRCYIKSDMFIDIAEQEELKKIANSKITEKEAIIKSRIGQGLFREKLLNKYKFCIISKIDIPQLLVASHLKPWAVSTNDERLSVNNGLLLNAIYDKLLDSGLISFKSDGKIIISKIIDKENRNRLSLVENQEYEILCNQDMKIYLEYHNDVIFLT